MRQKALALVASTAVLLAAAGALAHHQEGHNPPGLQNGPHNTTVNIENEAEVEFTNTNTNNINNSSNLTNTNNITNNNTNTNTNTNTNNNTNTNTNTSQSNSNATSTSNATASATGGNADAQGGNASTSTSVSIEGDENPASSAAPVYLTSSNDTCMGSTGIGGQGMTFGFSVGTTWTDNNCIMLKNSREMKNQGHDKAAKARLCMDEDNAIAFELAGTPCPRKLKSTQNAVAKINFWNETANDAKQAGDQTAFATSAPTSYESVE